MVAEIESKLKDELKMELERRGAIIDPDTFEKVSIMEMYNGDGEKERLRYPFEDDYHNRPKSTMGD